MAGPAFYTSVNSIYISLLPITDPHRSSQIPTLLSYSFYHLYYPTDPHRASQAAAPASYLLPTPFTRVYSPSQIFIDLYNSLTDPHRSSQFLSLIHYPIILPIGPACHCGRSCLSHSFNFIYISLLPFTDFHRFSQILTLLSYYFTIDFIPQILTDPPRSSHISTTPLPILIDIHTLSRTYCPIIYL